MPSSTFDSQQIPLTGDEGSYPPTSEQSHAWTWNQVFGPKASPRNPEQEAPYLPSDLPVQQYSQRMWQKYQAGGTVYPHQDRSENLNVSEPAHQQAEDLRAYRPPSVSYQNASTSIDALRSARDFPYPPVPVQPSLQESRGHQRNMSGCYPPTANSPGMSDARSYHCRESRRSRSHTSRSAEAESTGGAEYYHTTSGRDYTAGYHYSGHSRAMDVIYEQ